MEDSLGLGATGGGFFLGVWSVAIGDVCLKQKNDSLQFLIHECNYDWWI